MRLILALVPLLALAPIAAADGPLPDEPLAIGTEPQFVFDNYVIDNYWALKNKRESVRRVFHQPQKFAGNPVIAGTGGGPSVVKDASGFTMWYQASVPDPNRPDRFASAIAIATSDDGIHWTLPKLGLYEWAGTKENNIVWKGVRGITASGPFLLDLPERDRRGYRHLMLYSDTDGLRLIGSHDGIHWDGKASQQILHLHSDTENAIVYDPRREEYVLYCRAKHIYRTFRGDIRDTGESRRVARLASKELWTEWTGEPQNILIPDELDEEQGFNCFYGMPTRIYGGMYFGSLWPFKMNTDIHTELAYSRDGIAFARLPGRPKLIERGADGSWDDGMVFGGHQWIEVGDEWWLYYAGWDGPHGTRERTPGIGLVNVRKEGLVSMRGPPSGGVLVTRPMVWPGGKLLVNADAAGGELRVRVCDGRRKVLSGFDYDDCQRLTSDGVASEVQWKEKSLEDLAGQTVRLEFLLTSAELYTFRAGK
jgi:predicted GH43/DUF377 family glycosyl hydrolase